jgi:ABC-2 type transport system ATP-binding protein
MIEIKDYKKRYGGHLVLQIDDLQISEGIHWIVGQNGSGKSTFFKSLAGIIPFEGLIKFNGYLPNQRACKYLVNYSEAEPTFPDFLTGFEILEFIAKAKKAPNGQLQLIAQKLGLELFWQQNVGSYSSGMLKKISIVGGFLGNPKLIILDEPFILIDATSIQILESLITQTRKKGVSFLISSHQSPQNLVVDSTYIIENKTFFIK